MVRERTQLNINIDPVLLLKLKSEASKRGKTLTNYVIEQLKFVAESESQENLEQRLLKIEQFLQFDQKTTDIKQRIGSIFTDEGARNYGKVAKEEFEIYAKKKNLSISAALKEINSFLVKYPHSNPELVFQILMGTHDLTGLEMTIAYRHGSCAMRSALNDWTEEPLERLNKAFLNAVKSQNLAQEPRS